MSDLILPASARSYSLFAGDAPKTARAAVPAVRTASSSKVRRFFDQAFWAEDGLICIEDEKTGEFQKQTIEKFAHVVEALAGIATTTYDSYVRGKIRQMTSDALDVILDAKEQGDPTNPEILAAKARVAKRSQVFFNSFRT